MQKNTRRDCAGSRYPNHAEASAVTSRRHSGPQEAARRFRAAKELWLSKNADRAKADPSLLTDSGALVWWLTDAKHATIELIRAGHLKMPTAIQVKAPAPSYTCSVID
jgi:hypothetical protein